MERVHEDGLDEIIENLQRVQAKPQSRSASAPSTPKAALVECSNEVYNESIEGTVAELRSLLINLADSSFHQRVNEALAKVSFAKFTSYYITNAALGKYSMNTELQRLHVELSYPSSGAHSIVTTTDKLQILSFYESCKLHDIWRFCNQSIFADVYSAISSSYLPPHLSPHISLIASQVNIRVDYDSQISARSILEYSINANNRKLRLASIEAVVTVNFAVKTVRQMIETPNVNMIFDSDLRIAAQSMLNDATIPTICDDALSLSVPNIAHLAEKSRSVTNKLMEGAVASLGKLLRADSEATMTLYQKPAARSPNAGDVISNNKNHTVDEEWDDW